MLGTLAVLLLLCALFTMSSCGKTNYGDLMDSRDALYLIGCINIGGMHYEVRITSDEEMENNLYVHAIYEDNEYFTQAIQIMTAIIERLQ